MNTRDALDSLNSALDSILSNYVEKHVKTIQIYGEIIGYVRHLDGSIHFTMRSLPQAGFPCVPQILSYRFEADWNLAQQILVAEDTAAAEITANTGRRLFVTIPAEGTSWNRPVMSVTQFVMPTLIKIPA
jgi:hypothetical protein